MNNSHLQTWRATPVRRSLLSGMLVLSVVIPAWAETPEGPGVRRDGSVFRGSLQAINAQGEAVFSGQPPLPLAELAYWGEHREQVNSGQVYLHTGGWLSLDVIHVDGREVVGESSVLGRIVLPRAEVRLVLLDPPAAPAARDRLVMRWGADTGGEDQVLLTNGDVLRGRLGERPATAGEPAEAVRLQLSAAAEPLEIPLNRLRLVMFAASPDASPGTLSAPAAGVWLGLHDGSLLRARRLQRRETGVAIALSETTELTADESIWNAVDFLQPLNDSAVYLSDLEPLGYKHIPFLDRAWPYGADRNAAEQRLRSGAHIWPKGLGMYSTSRLAFEWTGSYRHLQAVLAIDELAGRRGSVVLRVFVERDTREDAAEPWKLAYESPVVRGGQAPLPVSVSLEGVRRLALIVDYADRGDEQDLANLLNARLVK